MASVVCEWLATLCQVPEGLCGLQDLAAANQDQVNEMWAGLGYYRRARFLLEGAKYVQSTLSGQMPVTAVELQKIPGPHCKLAFLPLQLHAPSPHQACGWTGVSDTGRPSQNIKSNVADLADLQLQSLHR